MITANIKDAKRYLGIHENIDKAFAFLGTLRNETKVGHFECNEFKVEIIEIKMANWENHILEAHKKYLDIHYVIEGSEVIGYNDIDNLEIVQEYDEEEDYLLLKGDMSRIYMREGDFCIVFPEDAHVPGKFAYDSVLKKAIIKIPMNRE